MRQYILLISLIIFTSCEGSRSRRMIDSADHAIDSYNNGDSTELIVFVVGAVVLGCIWLYMNRNKFK